MGGEEPGGSLENGRCLGGCVCVTRVRGARMSWEVEGQRAG